MNSGVNKIKTHGKQCSQPGDHDEEGHDWGIWEPAVVEIEVVEDADHLVLALLSDKCALVLRRVNLTALSTNCQLNERAH